MTINFYLSNDNHSKRSDDAKSHFFWHANISLMNERVKLENEVDDDI